ncbi:MAG: UDP-N-acetylmuramoylalanine--D-glutamate ligase MurD [Pseudomonadota bacterium]
MSQVVLIVASTRLLEQAAGVTSALLSRAGRTVTCVRGEAAPPAPEQTGPDIVVWSLSDEEASHLTWSPDWNPSAVAVLDAVGSQDGSFLGTSGALILRRDVEAVAALAPTAVPAGRGPRQAVKVAPRVAVGVGLGAPTRSGDWGEVTEGGMRWLVRAISDDDGLRKRKDEASEIHLQRLMPSQALSGWTDDSQQQAATVLSALTALTLGSVLGCPLAPMLHALRDARGSTKASEAA